MGPFSKKRCITTHDAVTGIVFVRGRVGFKGRGSVRVLPMVECDYTGDGIELRWEGGDRPKSLNNPNRSAIAYENLI